MDEATLRKAIRDYMAERVDDITETKWSVVRMAKDIGRELEDDADDIALMKDLNYGC